MRMIEIAALPNGAHKNQTYNGVLPDGWAIVPDDMVCENFPFGTATVARVGGQITVSAWIALPMPEPAPEPKREPTADDIINAMLGVTTNE